MGSEPVYVHRRPAGYVTSAAYGYTTGKNIACAWLPAAATGPGTEVEIELLRGRGAAVVTEEPLFDPGMTRLRN